MFKFLHLDIFFKLSLWNLMSPLTGMKHMYVYVRLAIVSNILTRLVVQWQIMQLESLFDIRPDCHHYILMLAGLQTRCLTS